MRIMPNTSYMPNDDAGKVVLMEHVHATLPKYTDVLEISQADMDTLKTDILTILAGG
jgi:hypothetical protein